MTRRNIMGKIKVRVLGDENLEKKQKEQSKIKAHEKKLVKGSKGGERIVAVGPSEEEIARLQMPEHSSGGQAKIELPKEATIEEKIKAKVKKVVVKKTKKAPHSQSYQKLTAILDRSKKYKLADGLSLLEKLIRSKFDETVELHINTVETGVSGNIVLPHGTGKEIRVAIASDDLLAKVSMGKIDFDILLAKPEMMPKLARVAKILGPKGLMPNPKNATLVKDPEKAALEFKKGQINFRTELKAPIMHLIVGKMSFGTKKLEENIQALINAIKREKIRNVTLKSTMSPGIKLEI
jgi:large subunit ribosomal protein L1